MAQNGYQGFPLAHPNLSPIVREGPPGTAPLRTRFAGSINGKQSLERRGNVSCQLLRVSSQCSSGPLGHVQNGPAIRNDKCLRALAKRSTNAHPFFPN